MTIRDRSGESSDAEEGGGLSSFLRSLLAGVPWSESAEAEQTLRLALPARPRLKIHNSNGRTAVIGEERDDILVRIEKSARAESEAAAQALLASIQVVAEEVAGALELDLQIPKKWNRYGAANLEVKLPRDLILSVSTGNGKVCVRGLRGKVQARSGNGSVSITDVVGDIQVTTANAAVYCSATCGNLVARSSNGKIELGEHSGSLDASTSNGLIRASLTRVGSDGILLATSNGRILLDLPDEVNADVDIRVENGIIRNHRELSSQSGPTADRIRGKLGTGGTPIKLRTSNGVISVH